MSSTWATGQAHVAHELPYSAHGPAGPSHLSHSTHPSHPSHSAHHRPRLRPRNASHSSSSPSPPPSAARTPSTAERKDKRRGSSSAGQVRPPNLTGHTGHAGHAAHTGRATPGKTQGRSLWGVFKRSSSGREDEPPSPLLSLDENGFSTFYGASASSPGGGSGSDRDRDRFVGAVSPDSESDTATSPWNGFTGLPLDGQMQHGHEPMPMQDSLQRSLSPPPSSRSTHQPKSRPHAAPQTVHTPARFSILPLHLGFYRRDRQLRKERQEDHSTVSQPAFVGYKLTRRRGEDGLILGAVMLGVWKLASQWHEKALAGEIGLLIGLCILYTTLRARSVPSRNVHQSGNGNRTDSPAMASLALNGSAHIRDRTHRGSGSHGSNHHVASSIKDESRMRSHSAAHRDEIKSKSPAPAMIDEGDTVIGRNGCVWGTGEREYRECLDDGVFFALLLGPLVASALLHAAFTQLVSNPAHAVSPGWKIEPPLVLLSTPIRIFLVDDAIPSISLDPTDNLKAISALVTARRNLVQLFTLCSFVLLVQLVWSLRLQVRLARNTIRHASTPVHPERDDIGTGLYWLRKGEWKRNLSVVGLAFLITGGCVLVKIVTAFIGHGVWSDMSPSDIVIATLFYQFSLYVCVRLARRGFTLGELGVVCNAATALFMETVNLTRMKIPVLRTPYIKTYRLPTPLLIFQLALIPGSLLTGFLLSPLLYLSRHLAQRPVHRLRFPDEKPRHRRLLALGFYAGTALVCGGIVGTWTRWCLEWRDPFLWVIYWILEGKRPWTRPLLLSYWGLLAAISVAGWNRQLVRARRHRVYVVPGQGASHKEAAAGANHVPPATANSGLVSDGTGNVTGISGVASQMMDAADQRLPTLSVNARRKFFHALAVVMFVPGTVVDPAFTHLAFSVAFALFNFAEYVRYFALWPFGISVHLFLNEFLDHKDSGTAILSHFYLLAGCASPVWLEGQTEILHFFGVLSLGIGDALASIVGRKFGRIHWSRAGGKTVEGSIAFFGSVMLSSVLLWAFGLVNKFHLVRYLITTLLATLLEALSVQNDNLILPMYGWAVGTLLGV